MWGTLIFGQVGLGFQPKNKGRALKAALRLIYGGIFFLLTTIFVALLLYMIGSLIIAAGVILLVLWAVISIGILYFCREPKILAMPAPYLLYSPASGKVDFVGKSNGGPPGPSNEWQRISIFMSIFDVHVQCAPVRARVVEIHYLPGRFMNALKLESSQHNEQLWICLETLYPPGKKLWIRLIAGLIARRIKCWVKAGEELKAGDRIGMIYFGSRVELYCPVDCDILVKSGQKVYAGTTAVARFQ